MEKVSQNSSATYAEFARLRILPDPIILYEYPCTRATTYGRAEHTTQADGSCEGHHAGKTLQTAYREDLLLLDPLLHSFPWRASPPSMVAPEVKAFLQHLAVERYVAAATQIQALNATVLLYRHVLEQPLGEIGELSAVQGTVKHAMAA